jgi:hypothetical protein
LFVEVLSTLWPTVQTFVLMAFIVILAEMLGLQQMAWLKPNFCRPVDIYSRTTYVLEIERTASVV